MKGHQKGVPFASNVRWQVEFEWGFTTSGLTEEQLYDFGLSFVQHGGFGRHWLKNSVALSVRQQ